MNKNKSFDCKGNDEADSLLCMLESNSVLSESFMQTIKGIILAILINLEGNEDWVEDRIKELKSELDWLIIFSPEFKSVLIGKLLLAFHRQKTLNREN